MRSRSFLAWGFGLVLFAHGALATTVERRSAPSTTVLREGTYLIYVENGNRAFQVINVRLEGGMMTSFDIFGGGSVTEYRTCRRAANMEFPCRFKYGWRAGEDAGETIRVLSGNELSSQRYGVMSYTGPAAFAGGIVPGSGEEPVLLPALIALPRERGAAFPPSELCRNAGGASHERGTLVVDAELDGVEAWIDGVYQGVIAAGTERRFRTPPLNPCTRYFHVVKVRIRWIRGTGEPASETSEIRVPVGSAAVSHAHVSRNGGLGSSYPGFLEN